MRAFALALIALALIALAAPAMAMECSEQSHEGNRYSVCEVSPATSSIALHLRDDSGAVIGQFGRLQSLLAKSGQTLLMAMNGGMYHEDRRPVGHYIENGREEMRVIASPGPGNFGLLPNGVFCVTQDAAFVIETRQYQSDRPACRHATQSGPMLVIDGALHPRFLPDSTSRFIRNAVGTTKDGQRVAFVISDNAVTFHDIAVFFRDVLKLPNALFLDGNISRLYAPALSRTDGGRQMGPIISVTPKS